jgi:arylsulfatase A-like enzyme
VRIVMVNDAREKTNERWDTHEGTYSEIEKNLTETDAALSALLDDLKDRGLLDTTVVVWMAEFGRSPKVDPDGGRDHWPHCYIALLAGGGIRGGVVHGSSDRFAAYPRDGACSPEDVHATIYHLLGVPLRTELTDAGGRPGRRCHGTPIRALI